MHPVLFEIGGFQLRSYAVFVLLAATVAFAVRHVEVRRLRYANSPGHAWVGLGALVGAVVGAKLGMVLFESAASMSELLNRAWTFDFTGKTMVGGLFGGYLGVELTKRIVGIAHSTGDAFAVALPLAQALGRAGCLLEGCCWGAVTSGPWAVHLQDADRYPVQLMEAALLLVLAGWLWAIRGQPRPQGHLFRRYLVGYGVIRFVLQFLRGDPVRVIGPLDAVQWLCLLATVGFGWLIWRAERRGSSGDDGGSGQALEAAI